jgi:GNAT superfamily N-acetyltransferase
VVIWPGKTLEYVTAQSCRRWPYTLLMNRANRRHQKIVDVETGVVVGYARWTLPELDNNILDNDSVWPDAQVPAVTPDREQEAKADHEAADYDYDRSLDELDGPLDAIMDRLKSEKPYIGKDIVLAIPPWASINHTLLSVLDILAVHPDNWRKGIATMLIDSGIREIETWCLPVDLDILVRAKKAALGVYLKAGFELVEQLVQDASMFGVEGGEYGAYFLKKVMNRGGASRVKDKQ